MNESSYHNYSDMLCTCIESEASKIIGEIDCSPKEWHEALTFIFSPELHKMIKEFELEIQVSKLRLLILSKMVIKLKREYKDEGKYGRICETLRKRPRKNNRDT